jgi:hypothetical protein
MRELSKRGEKFYSKWEERRKKKWLYIFLHGSVYWGLTVAIASFLWSNHFDFENMQLSRLVTSIVVFGVGGLGFGLWQFKRVDSFYLGLNDNDEIQKGIQKIQSGLTWSYENLKISQDENETLIVQNELFWFEKANVTPEEINGCFNLIMDDYNRLQKNPDFEKFLKNRNVKVQLFDNSGTIVPLIEKTIKNNAL